VDRKTTWDEAFAAGDERRSWYESSPSWSLTAIKRVASDLQAPIIDVGGGSSGLAGALLTAGYSDVTVLDLSSAGLHIAQERLGDEAVKISWVVTDLLEWRPTRPYRVWHDRAVLHFFTSPADRERYRDILLEALEPGGHTIVAGFAPNGPPQCSGLPVQRSTAIDILALLGSAFVPVDDGVYIHTTPSGATQPFTWVIARRSDGH
jgi:hypothetical protein